MLSHATDHSGWQTEFLCIDGSLGLELWILAHTPTLPVLSCWSRYLACSALVAPSKSWLKSHCPFLHTSASRLYGGQDGIVGWEAAAMAQRRKGSYITIITTRFVLELHISCNSAHILHWPGFAYSFKVMKLNVDTLRAIFWEVWCFWLFFLTWSPCIFRLVYPWPPFSMAGPCSSGCWWGGNKALKHTKQMIANNAKQTETDSKSRSFLKPLDSWCRPEVYQPGSREVTAIGFGLRVH